MWLENIVWVCTEYGMLAEHNLERVTEGECRFLEGSCTAQHVKTLLLRFKPIP